MLKQPTQRLFTAISPSIVNISVALLSQIPTKGFYVIGGSQSLRRGPATYHLGDTQRHSITADGVFQQISIRVAKYGIYGRTSIFNLIPISRNKKKDWKTLILQAFHSKCPLFELFFLLLTGSILDCFFLQNRIILIWFYCLFMWF